MAKSKVERSNTMHRALANRHIVRFDPLSEAKADYHSLVSSLQQRSNKVLSRSEKKAIYGYKYENKMGKPPKGQKPVAHKKINDIFRKYR